MSNQIAEIISYKFAVVLCEGLTFGLLALGIYVAFNWVRFPDLTPDGSFALGAAAYVAMAVGGSPKVLCLGAAVIAGLAAGCMTAAIHRFARVPTVVAGLLTASSLYSANWLLLGKPNQFLDRRFTLVGDVSGQLGAWHMVLWLIGICVLVVLLLALFSGTMWGLRARAIGENPKLANDLHSSETLYTFLGLAIANALASLAGALFAQRSFSADINMGIGMTITGLAGMILGLLIVGHRRAIWLVALAILGGSVVYKAVTFLALEAGLPAESFRLVAAGVLLAAFLVVKAKSVDFLRGIKWN